MSPRSQVGLLPRAAAPADAPTSEATFWSLRRDLFDLLNGTSSPNGGSDDREA